jgi:hypothetical protein
MVGDQLNYHRFTEAGLIEDARDSVKEELESMIKNPQTLQFVRARYYNILSLLMHKVKVFGNSKILR